MRVLHGRRSGFQSCLFAAGRVVLAKAAVWCFLPDANDTLFLERDKRRL
jgi:hypothetical protein